MWSRIHLIPVRRQKKIAIRLEGIMRTWQEKKSYWEARARHTTVIDLCARHTLLCHQGRPNDRETLDEYHLNRSIRKILLRNLNTISGALCPRSIHSERQDIRCSITGERFDEEEAMYILRTTGTGRGRLVEHD